MTQNGSLIHRHRESTPPPSRRSYHDISEGGVNPHVISLYDRESGFYLAAEAARGRHRNTHPTSIGCAQCMDGRQHMSTATKTPPGLILPFRAIGGKFETYWSAWTEWLDEWTAEAMSRGAKCFMFVCRHYSASHKHLGCAGWSYDRDSAQVHTKRLSHDLEELYGDQLMAVPTTFETDMDILTLHGPKGEVSGRDLVGLDEHDARQKVLHCFPEMDGQILKDLLPFMMGNALRVQELTASPRDLSSLGHHERLIGVGRGFDTVSAQNLGLFVNDIDPNLDHAISTAASIIEKNLENTAPGDDATVFTNALYTYEGGQSHRKAIQTAKGLQYFAQAAIRETRPHLIRSKRLRFLIGVTNVQSRRLTVLDQGTIS